MQTNKICLSAILVGAFLIVPFVTRATTVSVTQDDWSGGSGQEAWSDETKFYQETGEGLYTDSGLRMKVNADTVVGQDNFDNTTINSADPQSDSVNYPRGSFYDGSKFFVSDSTNNRVLIYNSLPTTDGEEADVIIGQSDFITSTHGTSATKLNSPRGIYSDGTKLIITDTSNHRVLIYNSIPTTNGAAADVVIGQEDFATNASGTTNTNLYFPVAVFVDSNDKFFIVDSYNNRILIYNSIPTTNGAAADVVVGQPDFVTQTSGTTGTKFWSPMDVYSDGTKLFVVDNYNHRVLIYNAIPTTNGVEADVVIGQSDFVSRTSGILSTKLNYPTSVYSDGTKLFVADESNHRVLIYNTIPVTDGAAADVAIGQTNLTTKTSGTSTTKLYYPYDIFSQNTKLFIADRYNNRVLIYDSIPVTHGAAANLVVGQDDFVSRGPNKGITNASGFCDQMSSIVVNGKLIASDSCNNRVLIFNSVPTSNGAAADVIIGQTDFTISTSGVSTTKLNYPSGLYSDGTKLFVADESNHRVLIYNSIPTTNGAAADVVIGQSDFISRNNGTTDTALYYPTAVRVINNKLFLVDSYNNRILIYNTVPTTNGAAADVVIGQEDFVTGTEGTTAANFNYPYSLWSDGTRLVVADPYNNRVLIYNTIPTTCGASADVVIGQDDFTSSEEGTTSTRLSYPHGVYSDGTRLFIADAYNYRILVYNEIPTENGAEADAVIGQPNFESSSGTNEGRLNVWDFFNIYFSANKLFVSDYLNNRLLIFNAAEEVSASLTSSTFTSATDQDWGPISWEADIPDYTNVKVEVSVDNKTTWNEVTNGASYIGRGNNMTYRVTLISEDGLSTPTFQNISFGQAAKDDTNIFTTFRKLFNNNQKLKVKNNQTLKIQNKHPYVRGEEIKLKNGKIEVYYGDQLTQTINIDGNGYWKDQLSFKNKKSYNLTFKYFDEFDNLLKNETIKIEVDSTDPYFKEKINKNQTLSSRDTKINFSAKDDETGIDYYKIKVVDPQGHVKLSKKQTKDYFLFPAKFSKGNYTLIIKAYDEAKNSIEKEIKLNVIK